MYSFDTSSLIEGRLRILPPDLMGSFWDGFDALIQDGSVRATDEVRREIARRDDDLLRWAKERPELFVPLDSATQAEVKRLLDLHERMVGTGKGRNAADPFVIALAMARSWTVVTEEAPSGNLDRPRIPDICEAMDVPCMNLIAFARAIGWKAQ